MRAYDEAVASDRLWAKPRIAVAKLFLDKYNSTEARGELDAALAIDASDPEVLLAVARVMHFEGSYQAMDQARKSLEKQLSVVRKG